MPGLGTEIEDITRVIKAGVTNINTHLRCFACVLYALLFLFCCVYLYCKFSVLSSMSSGNLTQSRCLGGEWTIGHHFLSSTLALIKEEQSNKIIKAKRSSNKTSNN